MVEETIKLGSKKQSTFMDKVKELLVKMGFTEDQIELR